MGRWEVIFETRDQAELRAHPSWLRDAGIDPGMLRIDTFCVRLVQPTTYRMSEFVAGPTSAG
ncbi:hypothetical protein [Streptacidiphilus neutrinimicus]|uniref:hypothetical protein n=1 Tax=Streptacidiphilus neutrinimicus TaxID=105420 RepID=UPI0005A7823F|nr:hypothetical protein [Streptacidiphilus neutrinimicus]